MNTAQTPTNNLITRFPLTKPHLNTLYGISHDPNTIDRSRYARKARALVKRCSDTLGICETSDVATQVRTLFVGLHRSLDWNAPVAHNVRLIAITLKAAEIICDAARLEDCTCLSYPEFICFSEDHLI